MNLITLPSTLAGINFMSHMSFYVNREYPIYKNNIWLYSLLKIFDICSHKIIYIDTGDPKHHILYLWHILKLFENNKLYNDRLITLIDLMTYFYSFAFHYKTKNHLGIIIYCILKKFKLIY